MSLITNSSSTNSYRWPDENARSKPVENKNLPVNSSKSDDSSQSGEITEKTSRILGALQKLKEEALNGSAQGFKFNETQPAVFGFKEVWDPLRQIIYNARSLEQSPYKNSQEAAFLDPEGVNSLLLTAGEQNKFPKFKRNCTNKKFAVSYVKDCLITKKEEKNLTKQEKTNLRNKIIEVLVVHKKFWFTSKSDKNNKPFNANILQRSKKSVVDFIQENVKNYYSGKELNRILFGLSLEKDGQENFNAKLSKVIDKSVDSYTGAELRMVYKIAMEFPDKEVRDIANKSIQFVKVIQTTNKEISNYDLFSTELIKAPWDGNEKEWTNRTRKNGLSYEQREKLPNWISRLITYKNEMKANNKND